jgi:hypothetical protein
MSNEVLLIAVIVIDHVIMGIRDMSK